jgi:hypothetical protein
MPQPLTPGLFSLDTPPKRLHNRSRKSYPVVSHAAIAPPPKLFPGEGGSGGHETGDVTVAQVTSGHCRGLRYDRYLCTGERGQP